MKKALVIIMKNPGTACNIGCIYCAEARKKYTSVENKITYEQAQILANLTKDYSLNVLFHGGEPTLLDCNYYQTLIEIFESKNDDVFFGIQTNGTKIDKTWIEFLKKNKKKVGISISLDGPGAINAYRLSKQKKETYKTVYENIKKLGDNGIKTGLICTIVSLALGKEQALYNMLMEFNNLQFVKLNPCMDRNQDGSIPFWGISPEQYFGFVARFFDIMMARGTWGSFYVEPIISVLKNIEGVHSSFCNYTFEKCNNFISVYPDGTITSCDNFNLQDGFIGNLDDVTDIEKIRFLQNNLELQEDYRNLLEECQLCDYKKICKGGCIAIRRRYKDTKEYCVFIKKMIKHIEGAFKYINEHTGSKTNI